MKGIEKLFFQAALTVPLAVGPIVEHSQAQVQDTTENKIENGGVSLDEVGEREKLLRELNREMKTTERYFKILKNKVGTQGSFEILSDKITETYSKEFTFGSGRENKL